MKWAWLFTLALVVVPRQAYADPHMPDHIVAVGPSVAYAHARDLGGGLLYGVDATGSYQILWASGGLRVFETFEADERRFLPYLEVGVWLVVNIGAGVTIDVTGKENEATGPHLFLGLPFPAAESVFAEPYYRATFTEAGTLHEGGALVKWTKWE